MYWNRLSVSVKVVLAASLTDTYDVLKSGKDTSVIFLFEV